MILCLFFLCKSRLVCLHLQNDDQHKTHWKNFPFTFCMWPAGGESVLNLFHLISSVVHNTADQILNG